MSGKDSPMSGHTPGPWEWDGKFTVSIPHVKGLTAFRTNPEDARLIAAAPELLEALRDLLECSDSFVKLARTRGEDLREEAAYRVRNSLAIARVTIAKADSTPEPVTK